MIEQDKVKKDKRQVQKSGFWLKFTECHILILSKMRKIVIQMRFAWYLYICTHLCDYIPLNEDKYTQYKSYLILIFGLHVAAMEIERRCPFTGTKLLV